MKVDRHLLDVSGTRAESLGRWRQVYLVGRDIHRTMCRSPQDSSLTTVRALARNMLEPSFNLGQLDRGYGLLWLEALCPGWRTYCSSGLQRRRSLRSSLFHPPEIVNSVLLAGYVNCRVTTSWLPLMYHRRPNSTINSTLTAMVELLVEQDLVRKSFMHFQHWWLF